MQRNQNSWLMIILSLTFLGIGYYWPKFYSRLRPNNSLATVISFKGTTEWISKRSVRKLSIEKSLSIQINESLATGTDGELVLHFKKGAEIKLLPSTFITLIRKANSTLIALRRGEIEVIQEGEQDSVLISQNGTDKNLQDYQSQNIQEELWINPQSLDTIKTVETNPTIHSEVEGLKIDSSGFESPVLSTKELLGPISVKKNQTTQAHIRSMISDRIARQKNHLFRCYSTLIQKKKMARGKLELHFTVNNFGKVEDPLIVKSEIKDPIFEKCLLQIISRTDFQSFHGQKISTFLPLRFEKNLSSIE